MSRRPAFVVVAFWAAACSGGTEPSQPVARIEAVTATSINGTVGTDVHPAPAVRATGEDGTPVAGVTIAFQAAVGSGAVGGSEVPTDADGMATVGQWTLGHAAGSQTLAARAAGVSEVLFTAAAVPGAPSQVTRASGDEQIGATGRGLPQPLVARVADEFGNPVAGAPVAFTVIAGGGSIAGGAVATDAEGIAASGTWTLGADAGPQQVSAASGAFQVAFRAFAVAPPAGLEGRIAFEALADGGEHLTPDIAVVNAGGSGFARLPHPGHELQPAWSPDGGRIAFVRDRMDEGVTIHVVTADLTEDSRLTDGPIDLDPAWSPDGSTIAFSSLRDGSAQIAALSTASGTVTVLADLPGFEGHPAWSPDGRQLAFVGDYVAYDFVFDIYTMNADGSGQTRRTQGFDLSPGGIKYYLHPAWSPDGSMIAFVRGEFINQRDMRFRVAVMSADGVFLKSLAWAGDIRWDDVLDPGSLTWSPNGDYIAYSSVDCDLVGGAGCSGARSVRYVSFDGSLEGTIVSNARSPSWHR
jgi:hypothetical protein